MNEQRLYQRVTRRALHRSRSLAVCVALLLLAVAAAYVAAEAVLAAIGQPALLATPSQIAAAVSEPGPTTLAVAAAAGIVGIILVVIAVAPGRRPRRVLSHDRLAVIVDDSVLASSMSRVARGAASVGQGRVRTEVGGRRASISVTPTSGFPVDAAAVQAAADDLTDRLALRSRPRVRAVIAESGVVGS
ncbi:hypothetical protein M2152_000299 [Microbacteriaceae bacterium SG_E_30_P1]|uniref:Alkaline shock response membrane anchor protein AmaP n=1 Tax=Antiquaquibacter oligotrophicus TaxID=2880260 RepID=A0ABT6KLY3_9MICO|nr:hypothetical protein [Antiquaquibacter oligotrophicus]MDH6180117.1 hypothetical protein [Antiquaquibacter oligotrophicus]UDF14132.1 hypothetical protein LH407_04545 [Antiquaquibacter oligotrophicus]